jgi:hypothetical protein
MEQQQITKKIIKYVAERRIVKYIQLVELLSFMFCGYTITINFMLSGIFLILGFFFAIIAGESALLEHDLKKVNKSGC